MKKPALLLLCLLLAAAGFGATITLEPGTPVFRTPELPSEVIAVASARTELPETGSKLVLIQRHPLARYYRLSEVRMPDGRSGYTHPRILLTLFSSLASSGNSSKLAKIIGDAFPANCFVHQGILLIGNFSM